MKQTLVNGCNIGRTSNHHFDDNPEGKFNHSLGKKSAPT